MRPITGSLDAAGSLSEPSTGGHFRPSTSMRAPSLSTRHLSCLSRTLCSPPSAPHSCLFTDSAASLSRVVRKPCCSLLRYRPGTVLACSSFASGAWRIAFSIPAALTRSSMRCARVLAAEPSSRMPWIMSTNRLRYTVARAFSPILDLRILVSLPVTIDPFDFAWPAPGNLDCALSPPPARKPFRGVFFGLPLPGLLMGSSEPESFRVSCTSRSVFWTVAFGRVVAGVLKSVFRGTGFLDPGPKDGAFRCRNTFALAPSLKTGRAMPFFGDVGLRGVMARLRCIYVIYARNFESPRGCCAGKIYQFFVFIVFESRTLGRKRQSRT